MIDPKERVICDRDLYVKRSMQGYSSIDIKAGTPFLLYDLTFDKTHALVQGFAGYTTTYPIEWFTQWFPSEVYKEAYEAWLKVNCTYKYKRSFIAGFIAAREN